MCICEYRHIRPYPSKFVNVHKSRHTFLLNFVPVDIWVYLSIWKCLFICLDQWISSASVHISQHVYFCAYVCISEYWRIFRDIYLILSYIKVDIHRYSQIFTDLNRYQKMLECTVCSTDMHRLHQVYLVFTWYWRWHCWQWHSTGGCYTIVQRQARSL